MNGRSFLNLAFLFLVACGGAVESRPRAVDEAGADAAGDASVGDAGVGDAATDSMMRMGVLPSDASNALPGDATGCNRATCPTGCCDATGICRGGSSGIACGTGGSACQTCSTGTECLSQQCTCNQVSCPNGCCAVGGAPPQAQCEPGTADSVCGNSGGDCRNCAQVGGAHCAHQQCDVSLSPPPLCACTTGCCDTQGRCQPGASDAQCGAPGVMCQDCTQSAGMVCQGQSCLPFDDASVVCNAQTCPAGCCDTSGMCQQGVSGLACGNFGTNCENCLPSNTLCTNQQCTAPPDAGPTCGPQNCSGCCDSMGHCLFGRDGTLCGTAAKRCVDCLAVGAQCQLGTCTMPDGGTLCSQTCDGCCDANGACQAGVANAQCGENGSACEDCTQLSPPTCDVAISPRQCTSKQTICPGVYAGCPPALQEMAATSRKVCSMAELLNAAGACAGGAHTAACTDFLGSTLVSRACGSCLQTFDFDFVEQAGIRTCVAPFVDAVCNHNSACIVDCIAESCFNCSDAMLASQCEGQVPSGACKALYASDACVSQALGGAAGVCNPTTYQGNFGKWLGAVGTRYCGM